MSVCTLRANMILEDGNLYPRGTVLDLARVPLKWRGEEYITKGEVDIDQVTAMDEIDVDEEIGIQEDGEENSPMQELKLPEKKRLVRRRKG